MLRAALVALVLTPLLAVAEEARPPEWKGTVGAGVIVLAGNSDTTTITGAAAASRETLGWILSAKAAGAYGTNRPQAAPHQVTALNGTGQLRLDRKLGPVWTVYALGGVDLDHVASLEDRVQGELGGSALWLDEKEGDWQRLSLRTDLGLRYAKEARYVYYGAPVSPLPSVEMLSPRLGLAFRYGFSKEVFVTEDAEVLPAVTGESRVLVRSVSKLSSRLWQSVTVGVSYAVTYDSRPAPGKRDTDQALTAVLEVGF
jgi:hypothetical protein